MATNIKSSSEQNTRSAADRVWMAQVERAGRALVSAVHAVSEQPHLRFEGHVERMEHAARALQRLLSPAPGRCRHHNGKVLQSLPAGCWLCTDCGAVVSRTGQVEPSVAHASVAPIRCITIGASG